MIHICQVSVDSHGPFNKVNMAKSCFVLDRQMPEGIFSSEGVPISETLPTGRIPQGNDTVYVLLEVA